MSNRTYSHLGAKVGGIVDAKNAAYGLFGAQQQEERKKQECASVRQQDAAAGSMEPNASAASDASRQTTANVEEPNARRFVQPSKPPCATTSEPTAAPAPDATENASVEEGVQLAQRRNSEGLCAICPRLFRRAAWIAEPELVICCSKYCADRWEQGERPS